MNSAERDLRLQSAQQLAYHTPHRQIRTSATEFHQLMVESRPHFLRTLAVWYQRNGDACAITRRFSWLSAHKGLNEHRSWFCNAVRVSTLPSGAVVDRGSSTVSCRVRPYSGGAAPFEGNGRRTTSSSGSRGIART